MVVECSDSMSYPKASEAVEEMAVKEVAVEETQNEPCSRAVPIQKIERMSQSVWLILKSLIND